MAEALMHGVNSASKARSILLSALLEKYDSTGDQRAKTANSISYLQQLSNLIV